MSKKKSILLWILSAVLMVSMVFYQRLTGPTHPVHGTVTLNSNEIDYKLPRSHSGDGSELIRIDVPDKSITGNMQTSILQRDGKKRFWSNWNTEEMKRTGSELTGNIPTQPPAGKVKYIIHLKDQNGNTVNLTKKPPVIRFTGAVPSAILITHILFMFAALIFSTKAGLDALFKADNMYRTSLTACISLFIGGMILGPIVQEYAFGAYWTGWPISSDLTDNKTLIAVVMWIIAVFRLRKDPNARGWVAAASLVMMAVYLIPHSILSAQD